ncbi:YbaY family lipoprotein [Halotalea alkalilenta]|uniref:YbaY family lipoprotein n=1 Tax=Halotalea alkalilenta TaxID=376489 RepID=UPI0004857090|nr:YbaY family lipoprotein [Halotalea alkalilenta]
MRPFKLFTSALAVLLLGSLGGCALFSSGPDFATLEGEVELTTPPPANATLEVSLIDLGTGRETVAITRQPTQGGWPQRFSLVYDASSIDPQRRYALEASLRIDGKLRYLDTEPLPVLTQGGPSRDIRLELSPSNE